MNKKSEKEIMSLLDAEFGHLQELIDDIQKRDSVAMNIHSHAMMARLDVLESKIRKAEK